MADQTGPLTRDQLLATWIGAVDDSYSQPFIEAGEGGGLEAYTQAFEQYARVSQAIDVSTQALFILPWSGQTNDPASGPQNATVTLTISRSKKLEAPLVVGAGIVFIGESATDWGSTGTVQVLTGLRYTLVEDLVFLPGETGPFNVQAIAERPGYGYNNPLEETITAFSQPGTEFNNTGGTFLIQVAGATPPMQPPPTLDVVLTASNEPDMFVPEHIGQYVRALSGSNVGYFARVVGFDPPNASLNLGSTVHLEQMVVIESFSAGTGTFQPGELVQIKNGGTVVGWGLFVVQRASLTAGHFRTAFVLQSGAIATGNTLLGQQSMATATANLVLWNPQLTLPDAAVGWQILDWGDDLGLVSTNAQKPSGGKAAMLDGLGRERDMPRHVGETDDIYRKRIWQVADVVTPNAIKRAIVRKAQGLPYCFLEVGTPQFPGFFLDVDALDYNLLQYNGNYGSIPFGIPGPTVGQLIYYQNSLGQTLWKGYLATVGSHLAAVSPGNDLLVPTFNAGDLIVSAQPTNPWTFTVTSIVADGSDIDNRYKVLLDYAEFRGFFLVGLPIIDWGDFGCAYDAHPNGFYDRLLPQNPNFYDGRAILADQFYTSIYQAVDKVRAGGVGFDIVQDPYPCPT